MDFLENGCRFKQFVIGCRQKTRQFHCCPKRHLKRALLHRNPAVQSGPDRKNDSNHIWQRLAERVAARSGPRAPQKMESNRQAMWSHFDAKPESLTGLGFRDPGRAN
jgi:hypothetical protein